MTSRGHRIAAWFRETGLLLLGLLATFWLIGAIMLMAAASLWLRLDPLVALEMASCR